VVNDACSHSDIISVIIYIPQRYVSKYIWLIYSRIKWNVPAPSLNELAWEKQLAIVSDLIIQYNNQTDDVDKATEALDDARAFYSREVSALDNLYFDLEMAKKLLKALPLA